MASRRTRKVRKTREDPVLKLAKTILPFEQCHNLAIRDVANHTEADQRASIRSGETRTVRKLTRVERLTKAGVITPEQAAACEWYSDAYELGFRTIGCTANYTGAGGGGFGSSDLFARYKAQAEARENFYFARQAIPKHMRPLFDMTLLDTDSRMITLCQADKLRFSLAAFLLHQQIGHMLLVAA